MNATSPNSGMWKVVIFGLPLVIVTIFFMVWRSQVNHLVNRAVNSYGTLPAFQFVNQNGARFGSTDLEGKIWIADFIFTSCPGPCPMISSRMSELQKPLAKTDVNLVSFTVDPDKDTPEVLRDYAEKLHAQPQRWNFLTGPKTALYDLSANGFKLAATEEKGVPVHSTRMVLVDRHHIVRGYYDALAPDAVTKVLADANHLLREQPK
ncbi:MAG: SCO family protein [Spartobacteria bacterium]